MKLYVTYADARLHHVTLPPPRKYSPPFRTLRFKKFHYYSSISGCHARRGVQSWADKYMPSLGPFLGEGEVVKISYFL